MGSIEIRVLGSSGIEDHHAHLLRLDPADRVLRLATRGDERGIDSHCLRLLGAQAILIGGYVDGTMRACFEVIPDRTARRGEAAFTAEPGCPAVLVERLAARLFDEACTHRIIELKLRGIRDSELLRHAALANSFAIDPGAPLRLRFMPLAPSIAPDAMPADNFA